MGQAFGDNGWNDTDVFRNFSRGLNFENNGFGNILRGLNFAEDKFCYISRALCFAERVKSTKSLRKLIHLRYVSRSKCAYGED